MIKIVKYVKQRIRKVERKILKKIKQRKLRVKEYLIFKSGNDKKAYHNLSRGRINENEVVLINIKTAGETPILCRNNNSDHFVVYSTFLGLYHLPPKKLKSNAVIADLGANIGLTIRHLKYLYPHSKIIGVEMHAENHSFAKKNLNGVNNCLLINAAIWYRMVL